jgi:MOSC domain-containing protein YiiM
MKLLSVNVSLPKTITHQGRTITTGIFKEPVHGRLMARSLGLEGDGQADRTVHGGVDMAVYAYPVQHYAFWEGELRRSDFPHGQFGENLTVEGLAEDTVRVGDSLRVGDALVQVTQPRIPCYKLAMRMDQDLKFLRRFLASGRVGFYCRVLEEGEIGAGDTIERVDRDDDSVTIAEFVQVHLSRGNDPDGLRRVLASRNLSEAWRKHLQSMLDKAAPSTGETGRDG